MTLHSERIGRGRPLLMVHGLGGSTRSWDLIAPTLGRSRELVLVDLPGHGASPAILGRQTIAAYADALSGFTDDQGLAGVDLVGSSVGARLVLELARRGVGGACVALDPGGFWRGWETAFFHATLAASIRLVRWLQPVMPWLTRHAATRTLLLAQLSARPWRLPPDLVLTEMRTFAATAVFDDMLRELANGPLQAGTTHPPGPRGHRLGSQRPPTAPAPGEPRPGRLSGCAPALVCRLRPLPPVGPAGRDGAADPPNHRLRPVRPRQGAQSSPKLRFSFIRAFPALCRETQSFLCSAAATGSWRRRSWASSACSFS